MGRVVDDACFYYNQHKNSNQIIFLVLLKDMSDTLDNEQIEAPIEESTLWKIKTLSLNLKKMKWSTDESISKVREKRMAFIEAKEIEKMTEASKLL